MASSCALRPSCEQTVALRRLGLMRLLPLSHLAQPAQRNAAGERAQRHAQSANGHHCPLLRQLADQLCAAGAAASAIHTRLAAPQVVLPSLVPPARSPLCLLGTVLLHLLRLLGTILLHLAAAPHLLRPLRLLCLVCLLPDAAHHLCLWLQLLDVRLQPPHLRLQAQLLSRLLCVLRLLLQIRPPQRRQQAQHISLKLPVFSRQPLLLLRRQPLLSLQRLLCLLGLLGLHLASLPPQQRPQAAQVLPKKERRN